jgi:hypothetical protein
MAKLLGQRLSLEYNLDRRGAAASHKDTAVKTAANPTSRMPAS